MRIAAVFALACVALLGCSEERATAPPDDANTSSVPPEAWLPTGITARRSPQRLLIQKSGWRSGPEALIVDATEGDVARLHRLLADNERASYACGYHWSFDFEYVPGVLEGLGINEQCETFRRDSDEIWSLLKTYFERASKQPTHHVIRVEAKPGTKAALERQIEAAGFGLAFNTDPGGPTLLVAQPKPWEPQRIEELRKSSTDIVLVEPIKSYDTGS